MQNVLLTRISICNLLFELNSRNLFTLLRIDIHYFTFLSYNNFSLVMVHKSIELSEVENIQVFARHLFPRLLIFSSRGLLQFGLHYNIRRQNIRIINEMLWQMRRENTIYIFHFHMKPHLGKEYNDFIIFVLVFFVALHYLLNKPSTFPFLVVYVRFRTLHY